MTQSYFPEKEPAATCVDFRRAPHHDRADREETHVLGQDSRSWSIGERCRHDKDDVRVVAEREQFLGDGACSCFARLLESIDEQGCTRYRAQRLASEVAAEISLVAPPEIPSKGQLE